ncbi:MAG TPA: IS481 family transposase [Anaerolineae bacterium]|nr:IS481 family transposase [Anaerolineae bacterium]
MPWKARDVMELRIEFVVRAAREEMSLSALCAAFGISRPTGYRWLHRYEQAQSVLALADRSRRPCHSPHKTPEVVEEAVLALRAKYGWGARKLQVLLREQGYQLPAITINRILKRRGLVPKPERIGQATRRFQRERCNELAQLDFKGEYRVEGGLCYPLSLLDDHSRYLLGLWALPTQATAAVQQTLRAHFRQHGMPEALLLDHGVPWWSSSSGHGLTRLSVWLMKHGVALVWTGLRHPQTQGKVERMHRTLKERTRHEGQPSTLEGWQQWTQEFRREYNRRRPHEALGMKTPAQVYGREHLRVYREPVREWDYGEARTKVLNGAGCLTWNGRRYFVCEALAGERVRIDELEELLLVTFRQTTVRQINLRTHKTTALLLQPPKL